MPGASGGTFGLNTGGSDFPNRIGSHTFQSILDLFSAERAASPVGSDFVGRGLAASPMLFGRGFSAEDMLVGALRDIKDLAESIDESGDDQVTRLTHIANKAKAAISEFGGIH